MATVGGHLNIPHFQPVKARLSSITSGS